MKLTKSEKKLAEYARKKGLIALYLFGSAAHGKMSKLSDVDIAVLLPKDVPAEDYFDRRLQITLDLMRILRQNEVDLVVLNQVPPLLKYQVVTYGRVLYCRDDLERSRFEARAIVEYLDLKPVLDLQFEYLKRRLKEGKFGVRPKYSPGASEED